MGVEGVSVPIKAGVAVILPNQRDYVIEDKQHKEV